MISRKRPLHTFYYTTAAPNAEILIAKALARDPEPLDWKRTNLAFWCTRCARSWGRISILGANGNTSIRERPCPECGSIGHGHLNPPWEDDILPELYSYYIQLKLYHLHRGASGPSRFVPRRDLGMPGLLRRATPPAPVLDRKIQQDPPQLEQPLPEVPSTAPLLLPSEGTSAPALGGRRLKLGKWNNL